MRIELELPFSLSEIKSALGLFAEDGDAACKVTAISTDTRTLKAGDLFFALPGETYDGGDFVPDALSRGAIAITEKRDFGAIVVKDVKDALLAVAALYQKKLPALRATVAVTGSVGKTTTKEFLRAILSAKYNPHATSGNENNEVGVPLTVLSAPKNTEVLVLECGMNHPGELRRIGERIVFDHAIVTKVGCAHIGNFGSREMIAKAKLEITEGVRQPKTLIPCGEPLLESAPYASTVSTKDPSADFFLMPIREDLSGTVADLFTDRAVVPSLFLPIPGTDALECLAFALATASLLGLSADDLSRGMKGLSPDLLRKKLRRAGKLTLLDDSYNSSPEAVETALGTLDLFRGVPKSALLGDMTELGALTEEKHREIGRLCARHGLRELYAFGVYSDLLEAGAIEGGMPKECIHKNLDTAAPKVTVDQIRAFSVDGELILCKASHALMLSRITDALVEEVKRG